MRQRYFSPDGIGRSQESFLVNDRKPQQRLRSNGSVTTLLTNGLGSYTEDVNTEVIGHYQIDTKKQIGSGYSSKVYKAISLKSQKSYAVKVLNIKKFSPSSLAMLENEIRILQRLNHPNVLRCYEVFKTQHSCYIVTEYCPSGDLQAFMTRKGTFEEKQAMQIVSQISEGVKYLFKNGIIHRDLKPANILRGKQSWKIADFGFAIQSDCKLTTKHNVGTPLYMPPEALIKNIYSPESDIFAVGIMLYELLFGMTPWECSSERQLIKRLQSVPFRFPSRPKQSFSLPTKHILEKLCNTFHEQRVSKEEFLEIDFGTFCNADDNFGLAYNNSRKATRKNPNKEKSGRSHKDTKPSSSQSKKRPRIRVTSKEGKINSRKNTSQSKSGSEFSDFKDQASRENKKSKKTISLSKRSKLKLEPSSMASKEYMMFEKVISPRARKLSSYNRENKHASREKSTSRFSSKNKGGSQLEAFTSSYRNKDGPSSKKVIVSERVLPGEDVSSTENEQSTYMSYTQRQISENFSTEPQIQQTCKQFSMEKISTTTKQKGEQLQTNHRVFLKQLEYCRFMYYLVKNINYVKAGDSIKQKIALVLFKLLTKNAKQLADNKNNWFGLAGFQSYVTDPQNKYVATRQTIRDYCSRYEKQYLGFLKSLDVSVVRQVNQHYSEVGKIEPLSLQSYFKLRTLVLSVIEQTVKNLSASITSHLVTISRKQRGQIEALNTLLCFYDALEASIKFYQNYVYFEENVDLEFIRDHSESSGSVASFFKAKDRYLCIVGTLQQEKL